MYLKIMISNNVQKLISPEKTLEVSRERESDISNIENTWERKFLTLLQAFTQKILKCFLLYVLLLLYSLNRYENSIHRKPSISACKCSKDKISSLKQNMIVIKNRILGHINLERDTLVRLEELSEESTRDWRIGLSESTIRTCNQYIPLSKLLSKRIFLTNFEFDTVFNDMMVAKCILNMHAPQLLVNELEIFNNAKILKYYTKYVNANSEIYRLKQILQNYTILVN